MQTARVFQTIDTHTAGEPLRIIVSGLPPIPGSTMLEKRRYFKDHLDAVRRSLMLEPRGHDDMYGCVITEPVRQGSDLGVLFMHNEGFSTMCGHGIIAVCTVAAQNGMVPDSSSILIDAPAGLIRARTIKGGDGRVTSAAFENVPSFVFAQGLRAHDLEVDVAFGGAFYAIVESPVSIDGAHLSALRDLGMRIKHEVERRLEVRHPLEPELQGIYGTIFTGPASVSGADRRNVTIFAEGEVDRSPCGTGTSAVLAARLARNLIDIAKPFVHESVIGTTFTGRILGPAKAGNFDAVLTEIEGSAFITGYHTFVIDPQDPVGAGFRI